MENKNDELFGMPTAAEGEGQPAPASESENEQLTSDQTVESRQDKPADDPTVEMQQERSVEDQTVERLNTFGDEIDAQQLGGIPVTPLDEDGSDAAEPKEGELCVMCGEKPIEKDDLCHDCRQLLLKTRFSFSSILFLILIVGVMLFGWLLSAGQLPTLQAVSKAYDYADSNHLYSAVKSFSGSGSIGWKSARNGVSFYQKSGYLSGIKSAVESYFYDTKASTETKLTWADKVGKANLNAPWNRKVKKIYADYNKAIGAYEKYYAYISQYDEQLYYGEITVDEVPYDDLIQKYEAAKETEKASEGLAFISYCEWYLARNCEKDQAVQLDYLKQVKEARPDFTWLYLTSLTELLVNTGDYDGAEACCQQMIDSNADDYYGEYYRAMMLRKQGKYDEAIAKMDKILETYEENGFYMAYYEAAINAFLKGDYEGAITYLEPCYKGEYLNYNTANFYALLNLLIDNEDEYLNAVQMIENNEAKLSPTVDQFINKQITAEEMFSGEGEPFEMPAMESEAKQAS